ncbi:P2X purinoceptor 7-like [Scomber japonicus]|uniref:P2X purinoceptor 7-like n=1 Tax=Scomber japonicus TaxID=13676 RepID=UPI002305F608|nr:P2X purinoceptor 7-like [Scomber japonicus]
MSQFDDAFCLQKLHKLSKNVRLLTLEENKSQFILILQAGRFSFIHLIIYIGSTLSYYALTTVLIDWLIGTSCYSAEVGQNYSEKKVEAVQDKKKCILCVSYVDENNIRLVKRSQKKSLQDVKPMLVQPREENTGHLRAVFSLLQPDTIMDPKAEPLLAP